MFLRRYAKIRFLVKQCSLCSCRFVCLCVASDRGWITKCRDFIFLYQVKLSVSPRVSQLGFSVMKFNYEVDRDVFGQMLKLLIFVAMVLIVKDITDICYQDSRYNRGCLKMGKGFQNHLILVKL